MRVRTGKIIKATSLLGQLNIPTIISKSTAASMIVEKKSNAGDFRFGEGINTGQGIFNIISGHIYFFYLKVKNLTPTNTQNRRFSIWDKTADQYVAWIDTTNLNDIEYIANWTATRSSLIYSCFSFQYASNVDNPSCEPELYIAIDLTETFGSGKEPTAQEFYNKYKDKLELLASGEEIVVDSGSGKANYLVESATTNLSGVVGYEMKCGNNAYGHQFTPSKWGTAAGYVINRASGGYNGMPMSEWHKTAGTDGGFYTWLNRGFTLTEGHTYTASVYVYSNKTASTNGYICSVNSSTLGNYYIVGSGFSLKPGWQRLTYTFTVASGKTSTDYCYSPIIYANPDDGE